MAFKINIGELYNRKDDKFNVCEVISMFNRLKYPSEEEKRFNSQAKPKNVNALMIKDSSGGEEWMYEDEFHDLYEPLVYKTMQSILNKSTSEGIEKVCENNPATKKPFDNTEFSEVDRIIGFPKMPVPEPDICNECGSEIPKGEDFYSPYGLVCSYCNGNLNDLRDGFALHAMIQILSEDENQIKTDDQIADAAYNIADAMMKRRGMK